MSKIIVRIVFIIFLGLPPPLLKFLFNLGVTLFDPSSKQKKKWSPLKNPPHQQILIEKSQSNFPNKNVKNTFTSSYTPYLILIKTKVLHCLIMLFNIMNAQFVPNLPWRINKTKIKLFCIHQQKKNLNKVHNKDNLLK